MLILRYLYDHPHLLGTSFLRQTRPFRGSLRELVATLGVQGREDARNLTSLRARRRSPGDLEQPPGHRRRKTFVASFRETAERSTFAEKNVEVCDGVRARKSFRQSSRRQSWIT